MWNRIFSWLFVVVVAMSLSFPHSLFLMPSADELGFVVDKYWGLMPALRTFLMGGVGLVLAWIYGRYTCRRNKLSFFGVPIVGIVWYLVGVPIYFLTVGGGVLSIRSQYYYALQGLDVYGILTIFICGAAIALLSLVIAWPPSPDPGKKRPSASQW